MSNHIENGLNNSINKTANNIVVKSIAKAAGGHVGVAVAIMTSIPWQKVLLTLCFFIFGLSFLISATPGVIFNSIFHINPHNNPAPVTAEERRENLYNKEVVYKQEESVLNVVKLSLDQAYLHARDTIKTMCDKEGFDYDLTMSYLTDLTVGSAPKQETDAEEGPVTGSIFNNEYNYATLIAAYSVSLDNLKPKSDAEGNHIPQQFEMDKNFETDLTEKIQNAYENKENERFKTHHGNSLYEITYFGEEEYGKYTVFTKVETIEHEDGTTETITYKYIKPIIHDIVIAEICTSVFELDMEAIYPMGAKDTTNGEAVATLASTYLSILYDAAGGTGAYIGGVLSVAEIEQVIRWVNEQYPNLTPARMSIVNIGLQSVGRIPYFLSGHADDGPFICSRWGKLANQYYSDDTSNYGKLIPYGLDCGSFVGWVYGVSGVSEKYMCSVKNGSCYNHWGTSRYKTEAYKISEANLLPGDIILKTREETRAAGIETSFGHIGIYICRDASGEPIILHCRTGTNGGSVLEKRSIIDSSKAPYYYRRLPIDYEGLSGKIFPKTIPEKSAIELSTTNVAEGKIKQSHKY